MGNPAFGAATYNGGRNWVKWLTGSYNDTLLLTYDLAVPGATLDKSLVTGASVDFIGQNRVFKDNFEGKAPIVAWNSQNSIFGFWFGINDINNGFNKANSSAIYEQEITQYFDQVHSLYLAGARKFFFLQAPRKCARESSNSTNALLTWYIALERYPVVLRRDTASRNQEISAKNTFNSLLVQHFNKFVASHNEVLSHLINVDSAFDLVLDNPKRYGAPNTTCENTDGTSCLWRDDLHAGVQIHNQVALKVSATLGSEYFMKSAT
jgi:phospholipase/lecithinase/hemolysin